MATSVRESIVDNIVTAVKSVKKNSGYDNDIIDSRVFRARGTLVAGAYPAVYIFEGDETVVNFETQGSNTRVHKTLDVLIEVYVESASNLAQASNSIEADLVKAIMTDPMRGGYADYTEVAGSSPFFEEGGSVGGRSIALTVTYHHKERDPYTV